MAHPLKAFSNNSNTNIVIDENTTLGTYRVQVFSTKGDITALTPGAVYNFTDADVVAGKLLATLRALMPGLL